MSGRYRDRCSRVPRGLTEGQDLHDCVSTIILLFAMLCFASLVLLSSWSVRSRYRAVFDGLGRQGLWNAGICMTVFDYYSSF